MKILVLDDDMQRHRIFKKALRGNDVTHVSRVDECYPLLDRGGWDVVYLDHDLNDFGKHNVVAGMYGRGAEITGADVALYIAGLAQDLRPGRVIVHSWNPDGARRMVDILLDAGVTVRYAPFTAKTVSTAMVLDPEVK